MKKTFPILLIATIVSTQLKAQPSLTQVKTDFVKNGVTGIEGLTLEKNTHLDHPSTKASFRAILPVKPEEVNGQAGVTLVRYMVAYYDGTGSNLRKTRSDLDSSKYKGIDLPAPENKDLMYIVKKQMMSEPVKLIGSMGTKISFDSVKVISPKIDWISPLSLVFAAKIYYTERVNSTDTAAIESPLSVTIQREDLESDFNIRSAIQHNERNVELSRKIAYRPVIPGKVEPITTPGSPVAGAWKKGDKVLVQDNNKWYPSTVIAAKPKEWFIHYDGFDSQYDEWVELERIKNK